MFSVSFASEPVADVMSYLEVKQSGCELWAFSETRRHAEGSATSNPAATGAAQTQRKQQLF